MWLEIAYGEVGQAQRVESGGYAVNAQSADPDGGRTATDIRTTGEARDPPERAEPQRTLSIPECGDHFASGQTVGDREVLELVTPGFESIDAARCANVQVSDAIIRYARDGRAALPACDRVGHESRAFGFRIV